MSNNENNSKNTAMIRIILYVIVMVILFLGIFGIVSKKITIPVSAVMLIAVAVWNSVSYLKDGKRKSAAFTFITSAILLALLIGYFITEYK